MAHAKRIEQRSAVKYMVMRKGIENEAGKI